MSTSVLPEEFADLEPFSDWAVWGEKARYDKRYNSTMAELQAFYDAAFPRVDDAVAYLEQFPYDDSMPEPATRSLTVPETRTSLGAAKAATRAPMWTAMPPTSSPISSTSPVWTPART